MKISTAGEEAQCPPIIEVISQHVELRKIGREFWGLCPFHAEKTPSFAVNPAKEAFYCFGCHAGGGVIVFVKLAKRTDFKGALQILGIDGGNYRPKARDRLTQRGAAMVAEWMNDQHLKLGAMCRELTRDLVVAEDVGASMLVDLWRCKFAVLETLFDDLQKPEYGAELYSSRDAIEAITADAPDEPLMEFPAWTPEYAAYLRAHLPEDKRC